MNDAEIRESFHRKRLRRQHEDEETIVINELGLKHGKCRADIVVVNGCLAGFEIKSDKDSLSRLANQIHVYDAIFDRIAIIVTQRHLKTVKNTVPEWWGVILCVKGKRGAVNFITQRIATINAQVDPYSVAQLLWKSEAVDILQAKGEHPKLVRKPRAYLYSQLVKRMTWAELKDTVRSFLKSRTNWRHHKSPFECDGLSQPIAK